MQGCRRDDSKAGLHTADASTNQNTLPAIDPGYYQSTQEVAQSSSTTSALPAVTPNTITDAAATLPPTAAISELPADTKPYTVAKGDTLARIAKAKGISVGALSKANPSIDASKLRAGQRIQIPPASASSSPGLGYTEPGRNEERGWRGQHSRRQTRRDVDADCQAARHDREGPARDQQPQDRPPVHRAEAQAALRPGHRWGRRLCQEPNDFQNDRHQSRTRQPGFLGLDFDQAALGGPQPGHSGGGTVNLARRARGTENNAAVERLGRSTVPLSSPGQGAGRMKAVTTLLVFCVGALLSLGFVMLYSAGLLKGGAHYLLMQLAWAMAGLLIAGVVAGLDYRWLKKAAWPLLALSIVLLGLVLVYGVKINGARRWFHLGVANLQPSEIAKLGLIIVLAYYGERYHRFMRSFWRGLVVPALIIAAVLSLIFVEPDRGTTILLTTVGGMMLILAGTRLWFIAPPLVCGAVALSYCLWHDEVRRRRILSWLDPEDHKQDAGYQVWRSMVGIGSGGIDGVGLGNGRQKAFVPEHHTDFIFSVVGEELGLIATLATVAAFVAVVICGVYIARRSRDTFGFLLASGITFLIGLQAAINIGVVTGALPNKGLPLPFISYGGSNLLLMLTCVGLLVSVARQARELPEPFSTERVPELAATQLSS